MAVEAVALSNVEIDKQIGRGKKFLEIFLFIWLLGNFGEVYLGCWNETPVALKKMSNSKHFQEFKKEAETLCKLNHPNIVRYLRKFPY